MSKQLQRHLQNRPRVKVAHHTHHNNLNTIWFTALATFFAGVFYFWGYYFGGTLWRALTGG
jgi:hypothetical protein